MFEEKKVLVADIGGTNANFAIIDKNFSLIFKKSFKTAEKTSIEEAIRSFLDIDEVKKHKTSHACFAMAGPINKERTFGEFTNLSWKIDTIDLQKKFNFKKVLLINDFEAIGYAIDIIKSEQYKEITDIGKNFSGVVSVIGAGTGLGMSILLPEKNKHIPIPSEGGHANLPINPDDKIELELYNYIKKKFGSVDLESVLSGRGISTIYDFLHSKKVKFNPKVAKEMKNLSADDKPRAITRYALENQDILCVRTIQLFIKFYARASRNLAITTLCSGLVLAGGISIGITDMLKDAFVEEFVQHDVKALRSILENISVIALTDYSISLYGAANALNYDI